MRSLEPEQIDLLSQLVEIARSVPREQRGHFIVASDLSNTPRMIHIGSQKMVRAPVQDVHALGRAGMLQLWNDPSGQLAFGVSPEGLSYYETRRAQGEPAEIVVREMISLLDADAFKRHFPRASAKWELAHKLLWSDDTNEHLTAIGHHCREAMIEFADELLALHRVPPPHPEKPSTVARLRAVIENVQLGKTERALLDALVVLWGVVWDLAQRQEHAAQREGQVLVWEDGRRLAFQTLNVLTELNRSLGERAKGTPT